MSVRHVVIRGMGVVFVAALAGCIAGEPEDLGDEADLAAEEEVGEAEQPLLADCLAASYAPDAATTVSLSNIDVNPDYGRGSCSTHFVVDRTAPAAGTYKVVVSLPPGAVSQGRCAVGKAEVVVKTSNGTQVSDYTMGTWDGTQCNAVAEVTFSEAAGATFRIAMRAERGYVDMQPAVEVKTRFSEYQQ